MRKLATVGVCAIILLGGIAASASAEKVAEEVVAAMPDHPAVTRGSNRPRAPGWFCLRPHRAARRPLPAGSLFQPIGIAHQRGKHAFAFRESAVALAVRGSSLQTIAAFRQPFAWAWGTENVKSTVRAIVQTAARPKVDRGVAVGIGVGIIAGNTGPLSIGPAPLFFRPTLLLTARTATILIVEIYHCHISWDWLSVSGLRQTH